MDYVLKRYVVVVFNSYCYQFYFTSEVPHSQTANFTRPPSV